MHISPNGKKYVGITSQEPKDRWRNGKGYSKNIYFYSAILKYGWDNFQHIVLLSGLSEYEANSLEEKIIDELDLTNPSKGYNLHTGGRHHKITDSTRDKISKSRKGVYSGEKNPFYGKHHTEETLQKIRKRVEQYSLDGEYIRTFDSVTIAAESLHADKSQLTKACKGKARTSAGYQWKYEDSNVEIKPYKRKAHNAKKVAMIGLDGTKVCVFESLTEAGKLFGLNADKCIGDCCRGEQSSAYGYLWKYE